MNWFKQWLKARKQRQIDLIWEQLTVLKLDPACHYVMVWNARLASRHLVDKMAEGIYRHSGMKVGMIRTNGDPRQVVQLLEIKR